MESFVETIRHTAFFSGFSREDLARVAGKLEEGKFLAGQVIISQGEIGDALYVVHSGAVEVILENEGVYVKKGVLGPHECFGEMALITGEKRSATVRTLIDTVVLKLGKEAWEEMLAKHPSLTLHFCKVLTRRLTETERDIWRGQGTVNLIMENFFAAQPTHVQEFLMQTSILKNLDPRAIQLTLSVPDPTQRLTELSLNHPVFIRMGKSGSYEYHDYLREFLSAELERRTGKKERAELHGRFASYFSSQAKWVSAIYHYIKAEEWKEALELIEAHGDELLESEPPKQILEWLEALSLQLSRAHGPLARLRAEAHVRLGDVDAAIRTYQEFLAQKQVAVVGALETAGYYQDLAELHHKKGEVGEALGCLRLGASLLEERRADLEGVEAMRSIELLQQKSGIQQGALNWGSKALNVAEKVRARPRLKLSSQNRKWIGLVFALGLGWAIWQMTPPPPLDQKGVHFLATLAAAVILWSLDVFDQHVVALALLPAWLLFGIAPARMVLAGFSKDSWFFVLAVLGMGAAVTRSGLLYRVALQALRRLPPDYKIYTWILAASGLLVTPLLPSPRARMAIIAPISLSISDAIGFKPRSNGSAGLVLSAFIGFSQMSFMFLTGATFTLVGWNLLPETSKTEFGWGTWTLAALPGGILTFFMLLVAIHILFPLREEDRPRIHPKTLETQLEILGPLTRAEWLSLAVLAFALVGWITNPLHRIGETWIAVGAFLLFSFTGVLDKTGLKSNIDWGLILLAGVLLSLAGLMPALKVDRWLIGNMSPVLSVFSFYPLPFLIVVSLVVYFVSFFLRRTPAVILLTLSLTPWAQDIGIHPGVLLLSILMAIESWFLPYQSDYYQITYYSTDEKAFSHAQARKLMVARFLASLLAITISVPYWRMLGFIH